MIVRISPRAEAELESILAYGVRHWGWAQAQRYADDIIAAFDRIAARSVRWQSIAADIGVEGYRYRCGKHVIYWRAGAADVTIIAVLHERMDQRPRLLDDLS